MLDLFAILLGIGIIFTAVTVFGLVLKLAVGILLIPIHLAFWVLKGAFGIAVGILVLALLLPGLLALLPLAIVLGLLAIPFLIISRLMNPSPF